MSGIGNLFRDVEEAVKLLGREFIPTDEEAARINAASVDAPRLNDPRPQCTKTPGCEDAEGHLGGCLLAAESEPPPEAHPETPRPAQPVAPTEPAPPPADGEKG